MTSPSGQYVTLTKKMLLLGIFTKCEDSRFHELYALGVSTLPWVEHDQEGYQSYSSMYIYLFHTDIFVEDLKHIKVFKFRVISWQSYRLATTHTIWNSPHSTPPVGHRWIWMARLQLAVVGGPLVATNCDLARVGHQWPTRGVLSGSFIIYREACHSSLFHYTVYLRLTMFMLL